MTLFAETKYIAVVIRQLKNHRPVASIVLDHKGLPDLDDPIHYLIGQGKDHIVKFQNEFVEFKNADWYIDIIQTSDQSVVKTEELKHIP